MDIPGAIIGGLSVLSDSILGGLNYANQAEQQRWERKMYKNALSREDSAVQRRVADLKAAGLSPVLAAGSGAQSMAPIKSQAPQFDGDPIGKGLQAMALQASLMQQKQNIEKTKQETDLIKMQKDRVMADTVGQQLMNKYTADSMGNRLTKLDFDVQLAKATNPQRIEQMAIDIRRGNIKEQQDKVDLQLKNLGVKKSELDIILADLKNRFTSNQLQGQVEDIIAKKLAVQMLGTQKSLLDRKASANAMTNQELISNIHEILKTVNTGKELLFKW